MSRRFVLPQRGGPRVDVDFEEELNPQQHAVVTCGDGPKLVLAGAGTGKTRTLTYRTAWLLAQGVPPRQILLVTFTNKAAREMMGRVAHLTGVDTHGLWGGTFHAVGARLLRRHAGQLGYTDSFSILDEADQRDLLRLCVTDLEIDVEQRRFPSPRVLASMLSLQRNTREPLEELVATRYGRFADWTETLAELADRYAQRKRAANAMDYDDLLVLWLQLLQEDEGFRTRYGRQFRHLLVDEYQDTNLIQAEIVEALAGENGGNLMVVGDDSQSIYSFRGANHDNILKFPERNPDTEVFKLEINYRSVPQILQVTNASIHHNVEQHPKTLRAVRRDGMLPALIPCSYPEQEAAFVAERVLQLRDEGVSLDEIAVLYRAHSHRLSVETTLLRYDIPYEVRGGLRFFEQAHIKDVIAHLRLAENPRDEVAFRRVLLLQGGVGNVTAERIWREVAGPDLHPAELVERLAGEGARSHLIGQAVAGWDPFLETLRGVLDAAEDPETAIRSVLEMGYEEYAAGSFDNFESRMEDLEQLAVFAGQYAGLRELLEELLLLGEMYGQDVAGGGSGDDVDDSALVLSTIHQAKGLEWKAVFVIHLVEAMFPSPRALDEPGGEEEERRIFYVAMTRARDELYLCYPIVRPGGYGSSLVQQPSRFLQELPEELYETWELEEEGAAATQRSWGDAWGRGDAGGPGAASAGAGAPGQGAARRGGTDPNLDRTWEGDPNVDDPGPGPDEL